MKLLHFPLVIAFGLILAACGSNSIAVTTPAIVQPTLTSPAQATNPPIDTSLFQKDPTSGPAENHLSELVDSQGAVIVVVKPISLDSSQDRLRFDVALDTHSVDLSMDLAALAILATDTGFTIQANNWEAPRGGHHVSGTLSFPASLDGKMILDGAAKLTLIIKDLDVPERAFAWDLN